MKALSESQIAKHFYEYAKVKYPDLLVCHVANERRCSVRTGFALKQQGVRKGMPDYLVFSKSNSFCGLAIELKKNTKCKLSVEQEDVLNVLADNGWCAVASFGLRSICNVLDWYQDCCRGVFPEGNRKFNKLK